MGEKLSGVNGNMIKWARERYNMSVEDTADKLKVKIEDFSSWECGESYPTYAQLKSISNLFRKPSAVFFFPAPPVLPPIKGNLRTLSNVVVDKFSINLMREFEIAQGYQLSLRELYGDNTFSILLQKKDFPKDMEQLCRYVREKLEFPLESQKQRRDAKVVFEIFRDRLYKVGVYVFKDAFKDDSVSGLCVYDEHYPIIMINNSMSFARQNFTLFHEFFHLLSGVNGAEIIRDDFYEYLDSSQITSEKKCDEFANEFLVPMEDFQTELLDASVKDEIIEYFARLYSVSKEAIMYKLLSMGKMTNEEYSKLKEEFYGEALRNGMKNVMQKNRGGNPYFTRLAYLGTRYAEEVFNRYFSGKIDSFKTSEMLNTKIDHLPKLESAVFRGIR